LASPTSAPAPGDYVGDELSLFADAHRWKAYWSQRLSPWVRGRVLDVGAGLGATARLFADRSASGYVALEPDRELAASMREAARAGGFPPGFEVRVGTTAELGADERFDTILYIDVLEHIAGDREELARAARLLSPDGRILVLSPAHAFLFSPFDAAIGHERRYDRASLRAAVPPGLAVERLQYLDSVGMLASLANRLLLRASMPTAAQIRLWDRGMVPVSRLLDPLTGHRLGKTIIAVLRPEAA
jgi:SAM-dependent methyltransferase